MQVCMDAYQHNVYDDIHVIILAQLIIEVARK